MYKVTQAELKICPFLQRAAAACAMLEQLLEQGQILMPELALKSSRWVPELHTRDEGHL